MNDVRKTTLKKIFHNKKLLITLAMMLVIGAALVVSTYTWFFKGGTLLTIEFQTGFVQINIGMYEGEDFDHDGVLDTDPAADEYTPVYQLIPASLGTANPTTVSGIQTDIEELQLPDITMEKLAPGQIYTYKFAIMSTGDLESMVEFLLTDYGDDATPANIKDYVRVTTYANDELIASKLLSDWLDTEEPFSLASDIALTDEVINVVMQFEFIETGDKVAASYEGGNFSFPNMKLRVYSVE